MTNNAYLNFLVILWSLKISTGFTSDQFQTTKVRSWTEWYNTDSPAGGVGDDEGVASIRQRGFDVCDGNSPINAVCRVATQHSIVFNEQTAQFTDDLLIIPCNDYGIICRNVDQINRTCLDYEIRFECLEETYKETTSVAVIGIAAGLSIVIPILCVVAMHIRRYIKRRLNPESPESTPSNSEQGSQTDLGDFPPSYSELFGENVGSRDNLIANNRSINSASLINETGHVNVVHTSLTSSGTDFNSNGGDHSGNVGVYTIVPQTSVTEQRSSVSSMGDTGSGSGNQSAFSRLRFPGLHLSIFEMFSSSISSGPTSPTSPTLSYIQTPPPTYMDAVKILENEKKQNPTEASCVSETSNNEHL